MLTTLFLQISARMLPEPSPMRIALIAPVEQMEFNPSASLQFGEQQIHVDQQQQVEELLQQQLPSNRHKREAVYDPYDVYYFYPSSYSPRPAYYQSYINRRDTNDNRITEKGQKYKYTPLFQYKSTQSKRRKLFVPNLFG